MKALAWVAALAAVVASAVVRHAAPGALAFFGAEPDIGLAVALAVATGTRPSGGAALGWFHGALAGWLAGSAFVAHSWSGCLAGLLASLPHRARVDITGPVCGAVVALASVVQGVAFMLISPTADLGGHLGSALLGSLLQGVAAIPVGALMRRTAVARVE